MLSFFFFLENVRPESLPLEITGNTRISAPMKRTEKNIHSKSVSTAYFFFDSKRFSRFKNDFFFRFSLSSRRTRSAKFLVPCTGVTLCGEQWGFDESLGHNASAIRVYTDRVYINIYEKKIIK